MVLVIVTTWWQRKWWGGGNDGNDSDYGGASWMGINRGSSGGTYE